MGHTFAHQSNTSQCVDNPLKQHNEGGYCQTGQKCLDCILDQQWGIEQCLCGHLLQQCVKDCGFSLTTSRWACAVATWSGVLSWKSRHAGLQFLSSMKYSSTCNLPSRAAAWRAVSPYSFFWSGFWCSLSIRNLTLSKSPLQAARCNSGVLSVNWWPPDNWCVLSSSVL